jgi:hypothetical protein
MWMPNITIVKTGNQLWYVINKWGNVWKSKNNPLRWVLQRPNMLDRHWYPKK